MYTPLGFENEFTLEKHPHGNSPSQNVHLAGGKTAGGTVVQQPQLAYCKQQWLVEAVIQQVLSVRPELITKTATLKIKINSRLCKEYENKISFCYPQVLRLKMW